MVHTAELPVSYKSNDTKYDAGCGKPDMLADVAYEYLTHRA